MSGGLDSCLTSTCLSRHALTNIKGEPYGSFILFPKGLSGSTLKLIAIIAMVIDHIGAALLGRFLMSYGYLDAVMSGSQEEIATWISGHSTLYLTYWVIRMIGRVAFPIFCFLLVEGFQRTRHMKKYVLRLGLFAILSEIPFDLATHSQVLEFTYQNVFFTLFFGLVAMIGYDQICRRQWFSAKKVDQFAKLLLCVLILLVCCTLPISSGRTMVPSASSASRCCTSSAGKSP